MKTSELMIGDWVDVYHELPDESGFYKPLQITGIHHNDGICFGHSVIECPWDDPEEVEIIQPIPLTSEIFEKNGFKKFTDNPYRTYYELGLNEYRNKILWYKGSITIDYEGEDVYLCDCENVHELQHALKLCGINKEITL